MYEAKILKTYEKAVGFPRLFWVGQENKSAYMVMELLGPSLEDLFFLCGCQFSLKTVLMLADQMVVDERFSCTESSSYTCSTTCTGTSSLKTF